MGFEPGTFQINLNTLTHYATLNPFVIAQEHSIRLNIQTRVSSIAKLTGVLESIAKIDYKVNLTNKFRRYYVLFGATPRRVLIAQH